MRLRGNEKLIYEQIRRMNGGIISLGTLACLCGCNKRTVLRIVQRIAARGLIRYESGCGVPNRYELT